MFDLLLVLLSLGGVFAQPHPHHPKALVVGGAAGRVTVTYYTVPFNPQHLQNLRDGFVWHLGNAALDTEVPLSIDGRTLPPGRYKMGVRYTGAPEGAGRWDLHLQPFELAQAGRRRGGNREQAEAALAEARRQAEAKGLPLELTAGAKPFAAGAAEHLELLVLHHGYVARQRGSAEAAEGVEFGLRLSFGELHREVVIREVFPAAPASRPSDK